MLRTSLRRRALAPALIAVAGLSLAVPAAASAQTTVDLEGKVTRSGKTSTLKISGGQRNADGSQPPTVSKLDLYFPKQHGYDPRGLPLCDPSALEREGVGGCSKASRVGTGFVKARAGAILADPKLTLFNAGPKAIILYVQLETPIEISTAIRATFSKASGPYGLKLSIPVPQNLQQPLPALPAAITDIGATVTKLVPKKGKRKAHSLITHGACGASGKLAFKAVLTHADGTTQEQTSESACR